MRAVIQRVSEAGVSIAGKSCATIEQGLLVFVGVGSEDNARDVSYLVKKTVGLRVFEDKEGKMNLSVEDVDGALLVVSQFTLFGDTRHGCRPNFHHAAALPKAEAFYRDYVGLLRHRGLKVKTGVFQEKMQVDLINQGPVTILLDSKKVF